MIGLLGASAKPQDANFEMLQLRREIERLREFVETRARGQENLMRALLNDSTRRAAEALEPRIRLAASEAMAYAEQGLQQHEAALRALGRRFAELSHCAAPAEPALAVAADVGAYLVGLASPEMRDCRRLDIDDSSEEAFVSSLANLPILPGGAAKLVASHVVEYIPAAALAPKILPHWRSLLAPGGELVVVTRDGPAWAAALPRAAGDFDALRRHLGADGAGRPPRNLFDEQELVRLLGGCGFADPTRIASADPQELRISARTGP